MHVRILKSTVLAALLGLATAHLPARAVGVETITTTFAKPGTYTYTVPTGENQLFVELTGAGGATAGRSALNNGGSGALVSGYLSVLTLKTLTILVGGGGDIRGTGGYGGGGNGINGGGGGGGRSAIISFNADLVDAGGGGGAGPGSPGGNSGVVGFGTNGSKYLGGNGISSVVNGVVYGGGGGGGGYAGGNGGGFNVGGGGGTSVVGELIPPDTILTEGGAKNGGVYNLAKGTSGNGGNGSVSLSYTVITPSPAPEPSSLALLTLTLGGLGLLMAKARKNKTEGIISS